MASSAATIVTQIVRAVAKAEKTFSTGCAILHSAPTLLLPEFSGAFNTGLPPDPPNVDLEGPPLAPPIALLLDGHVIWAPVVRGAIGKEVRLTGGHGGLTQAQIDRLLASFTQK